MHPRHSVTQCPWHPAFALENLPAVSVQLLCFDLWNARRRNVAVSFEVEALPTWPGGEALSEAAGYAALP